MKKARSLFGVRLTAGLGVIAHPAESVGTRQQVKIGRRPRYNEATQVLAARRMRQVSVCGYPADFFGLSRGSIYCALDLPKAGGKR